MVSWLHRQKIAGLEYWIRFSCYLTLRRRMYASVDRVYSFSHRNGELSSALFSF